MQHKYSTVRNKFQSSDYTQFSGASAGKRSVSKDEPCPACEAEDWCFFNSREELICNHSLGAYPLKSIIELSDGIRYRAYITESGTALHFYPIGEGKNRQAPSKEEEVYKEEGQAERQEQAHLRAIYDMLPGLEEEKGASANYARGKWGYLSTRVKAMSGRDILNVDRYLRAHQESAGTPGTMTNVNTGEVSFAHRLHVGVRYQYIFIPWFQNWEEKITSFQLRVTTDLEKIRYYSPVNSKIGWSGLINHKENTTKICVISEGHMTTETAMDELNAMYGIVLPGYGYTQAAVAGALALTEHAGDDVQFVIPFDRDSNPTTFKNVRAAEQAIADQILIAGMKATLVKWDGSQGKGIDDLLRAGGEYTLETPVKSEEFTLMNSTKNLLKAKNDKNKAKQPKMQTTDGRYAVWDYISNHAPGRHYTGVKLLTADAGLGKTTIMAEIARWAEQRGSRERTANLFRDIEKIVEYYVMIPDRYRDDYAVYRGRNADNCEMYNEAVAALMKAGRNVERYACATCPLYGNGCKYEAQKEVVKRKQHMLATHAAMDYTLAGYQGKNSPVGVFEHVYIDENPVGSLYQTQEWDVGRLARGAAHADTVITRMGAAECVEDAERGAAKNVVWAYEALKDIVTDVMKNENFYGSIPLGNLLFNDDNGTVFTRACAYVKSRTNDALREVTLFESIDVARGKIEPAGMRELFRAIDAALKGKKNATHMAMVTKTGDRVTIAVTTRRDELIQRLARKSVILDASANVKMLGKIFAPALVETTEIRVKPQADVTVTSVRGVVGNSAQSRRGKNAKKSVKRLEKFVEEQGINIKELAIITNLDYEKELRKSDIFKDVAIVHYGAGALGSNELKEYKVYIQLGHAPNLLAKHREYCALTGEVFKLEETLVESINLVSGLVTQKKVSSNEGFNDYYQNEIEAEQYQGAMRSRMVNRAGEKLRFYVMGNETTWPESLPGITKKIQFYDPNRRNGKREKKEENMKETAVAMKKAMKRVVNAGAWLKNRGRWRTAKELAEVFKVSAKTIMRYFLSGLFWRILAAAKLEKVKEKEVLRATTAVLARAMRLTGEIVSESVLLSRL
jgi:hypothetical protein